MNSRPWNDTLDSILRQGTYLVVSRFAGQERLLAKTRGLLLDSIGSLQGEGARKTIQRRGLGALHNVLPAAQIGALRDLVMPQIRPDLFLLANEIGRKLFCIEEEFFIDDYTILRINYPYLVARQAPGTAENPGIGRVAERTRQRNEANRIIDPVYNPQSYHNHEPPPAWAHGPHQDTWTGHSRLGVNLWWAIEDVPDEASMVFYPETFGRRLEPDPRSLYLKAGQPLPKPTKMALRCGEMLVFNPEMLHGTHLNTTSRTRLALSLRINPQRPTFDPACFYAREFWHSSKNVDAGVFDQIIRFARAENLVTGAQTEPAPAVVNEPETPADIPAAMLLETQNLSGESSGLPSHYSRQDVITPVAKTANDGWREICPSGRIPAGTKALVKLNEATALLLIRGEERLSAVQAQCPHLDIALEDGFHDDETIWCPAHAVAFSLQSGLSSCQALRLKTYAVREQHETIWIRTTPEIDSAEMASSSRTFAIHPVRSRPRLTVSILTKDSEDRLERLLYECSNYADQVLVGVDAESVDGTFAVAREHADLVYQFSHSGRLAAARMLPFEYATGDWILSIDDDESMEPSFDMLLPALLAKGSVTHYWFPRKWIVSTDPWERLDGPLWFPDWQLRLFRNDKALVWKPARPHSGYSVQGPGYYEIGASILHFEPIVRDPQFRDRKRKHYRELGADAREDDQFNFGADTPRASAGTGPRPRLTARARAAARVVARTVHHTTTPSAPWKSTIERVDLPGSARAGEPLIAEVCATNSGRVAWTPFYGGRSAEIQLGYHLLDAEGELIQWDLPRCPVLTFVGPGESATFLYSIDAPAAAGRYLLEFDFVSEFECWFATCGSSTLQVSLTVTS